MKILTVVGARPQFVKAAVVSRAFQAYTSVISEILVHTGQHYDENMSNIFFEELRIPTPKYNLGVGGGSHGQNTGRMLEKLESCMIEEKPDYVLVYGDTDSTLAGALAAAKLHIPVAHVEAGLRSDNKKMPEEINRILTDHISSLLFATSLSAQETLAHEGIKGDRVKIVGDVMYDAAVYYSQYAKKPEWFDMLDIPDQRFCLCTVHRAENTDDKSKLGNILYGLGQSKVPVIFPIHPRTRQKFSAMGLSFPQNFYVVDPVGYLEMIWLEKNCVFVATDSGGVQKEAYFHQKPCLTLRNETEWIDLVQIGANVLTGTDPAKIMQACNDFSHGTEITNIGVYGDGYAGQMIAKTLVNMNKNAKAA